ncbi:MAG: sugar transferase [Erysipelotrichaceae bacterium]|nr:sugar transferase [Erysipelotrichaceae bacterium]
MYKNFFKRLFDFILSLMALIILSPLFIVLIIVNAIKMKGNPFFVQERPGWHEKIFKLIKFRSMTEEKDENGNYLPDEVRLTKYGEWLRNTSLDEIPELINIFKGDMAIVGPRPLLVQYLPLYNEEQHHRHDVRPGLTGLAQVNGRFNLLWQEKFKYDVEYVRNVTLINDIKIILKTVILVFKKDDVENEEMGSWYPFLGNDVEDQQITLRKQKEKSSE